MLAENKHQWEINPTINLYYIWIVEYRVISLVQPYSAVAKNLFFRGNCLVLNPSFIIYLVTY